MKHPKTSHRLSKTIGQIKKVSQVAGARKNSTNSYTEMIKPENVIYEKKNAKIMKRHHVYKSYASTFNIQILSSSDP